MAHPNEIEFTVVVNGQPNHVEGNVNAPLHTLIAKTLAQSGNQGQPPENWELRDGAGQVLDGSKKIGAFNFGANATLFLNLKAGIGGAW